MLGKGGVEEEGRERNRERRERERERERVCVCVRVCVIKVVYTWCPLKVNSGFSLCPVRFFAATLADALGLSNRIMCLLTSQTLTTPFSDQLATNLCSSRGAV